LLTTNLFAAVMQALKDLRETYAYALLSEIRFEPSSPYTKHCFAESAVLGLPGIPSGFPDGML